MNTDLSLSRARSLPGSDGEAEVIELDPIIDPRWTALGTHPAAGLFHSPLWMRTLAEAYGFTPRALVLTDRRGVPRAGLPFCEIDDFLGRRIVALPFTDTCDPLVDDEADWLLLSGALRARALPIRLRCLDNAIVVSDPCFATAKTARWHRLAVAPTQEAQWAGLAGATRRAIRKAERSGVELCPLEGAEGVSAFHRLHVGLRKRKYRLLAQPLAFFAALRECFAEADGWFPLGAFHDGRLIGATVYLRWRDTLYYKFNASTQDDLAVRPNTLLLWAGIDLARRLGCSQLDLGPSDDDQPGLIRFKRNFGATETELRHLVLGSPAHPSGADEQARSLLSELTAVFTSPAVADDTAAEGGRLLYRYFA